MCIRDRFQQCARSGSRSPRVNQSLDESDRQPATGLVPSVLLRSNQSLSRWLLFRSSLLRIPHQYSCSAKCEQGQRQLPDMLFSLFYKHVRPSQQIAASNWRRGVCIPSSSSLSKPSTMTSCSHGVAARRSNGSVSFRISTSRPRLAPTAAPAEDTQFDFGLRVTTPPRYLPLNH